MHFRLLKEAVILSTQMETVSSFMPEEEQLCPRRFEEGFSLPDLRYISWLKLNPLEAYSPFFSTEPAC